MPHRFHIVYMPLLLPIAVSIFSLIFALFLIHKINQAPSGSQKMVEISLAIQEGAQAFLKRQYKIVSIVAVFLLFILWITLGIKVALGFLVGAIASGSAGFIGMMVSTKANVKIAQASERGLAKALTLSF